MSDSMTSPPTLAVIIPYFQREQGVLSRCVRSILDQQEFDDFKVIIVDDGSPRSAIEELGEEHGAHPLITIILQQNAGVSAARNTGLENVPAGTKYVAFIDSDDQWAPFFLHDAVEALETDHDVFFGNTKRFGHTESRFSWSKEQGLALAADAHVPIAKERETYHYSGDFFDYALQRSNIISTSTLVYRFSMFSSLRFRVGVSSGEDRLFKLALTRLTNRVAFSPRICATEGRGVNIFDNFSWGSRESLKATLDYILVTKLIRQELDPNRTQSRLLDNELRKHRHAFIASLLHLLRVRHTPPASILAKAARVDPLTFLGAPAVIWELVRKKAKA